MIKCITRQSVFDNYPAITSVIVDIQKAMFDTDPLFEDGDDGEWYTIMHDAINIPYNGIKTHYCVVSFDHSDISTFTSALAEKFIQLLTRLNISELIIIAHLKLSFIGNPDNKYPPLQKVIRKFEDITKDLKYEEAFKIDLNDLPMLLEIVFWAGRCDASAPEYIYFSDINERIAFNVCKRGGIHIIEYDKEILFYEQIEDLDMYFVKGHCVEQFSASSKIEGRISKRH